MSEVQQVAEKDKFYKWKIDDFLENIVHRSNNFQLGELDCYFYAVPFYTKSQSQTFWGFFIDPGPPFAQFYYTVTFFDRKGQAITTKKRRVVEDILNQYLIMFVTEEFLVDYKLIKNGAISLHFTFENIIEGQEECNPLTNKEPDDLLEDLSNDLGIFYENKTGTDCVLKLGETLFPAHRSVLSARSPVFASMFFHDTSENRSGEVNILDVDSTALSHALYYMYTGKIRGLSADTAVLMYTVADRYSLMQLKGKCLKFLIGHLTMENICDAAVLAHNHAEEELEKKVVLFIGDKMEELKASAIWKEFLHQHTLLASELLCSVVIANKKRST